MLGRRDDSMHLCGPEARDLFGQYTVAVGSTGNLGLAIGTMAAALGFQAVVHMSADAKAWKKARLRQSGVEVVEHEADYGEAVLAGRRQATGDAKTYFVDDENSETLFLGYSVAALRLESQLREKKIVVDGGHPLFVYLPCGVGGAPGGIAFGLRQVFGDAVHCFFAEPVASPCLLLALASAPAKENPSVYDIGLDNITEADGLAVGRASELAVNTMRHLVSGIFTVNDHDLFRHLARLHQQEQIRVEPSAAAGFSGPGLLLGTDDGKAYLERSKLSGRLDQAIHLVWTTGGRLVPDDVFDGYQRRGEALL